jgi:hypothetical protein
MSRLEGLVHRPDQIIPHGVEVYGPAQPPAECRHDRRGVITSPVEPAVNDPLHSSAQRVRR